MEGERGGASDDDEGGVWSAKRGEELLGIKLRKGISVGKRGGPLTPMPSWKMMEPGGGGGGGPSCCSSSSKPNNNNKPSARKLGASLWEAQELLPPPSKASMMSRSRHHQINLSDDASEPNSPLQAHSAARFMKRVGASFDQQRKLTERTVGDLKPESPASYNSSMEVSSTYRVVTPSSSLDFKARLGESGYTVKTSAELLKVLNRIMSLEEQLASSLSLVKTLKVELHHAHSRIQKLTQEQESYRDEMDELIKRFSKGRATWKNKEKDRIKATVESIKNELEEERELRRRSESLHRQLGKELTEANSALNEALNDLDSERKAHSLLEELCDEFAKGIQEYEQEIRSHKQKTEKDSNVRSDQTLHHISKIWMDEKLHMKTAEANGDETEKDKFLARLAAEVTTFLQARKFFSSRNYGAFHKGENGSSLRRQSLESVHLNGAVGAPQDAEDDDSVENDLQCFELNMGAKGNISQSHLKETDEEGMERLKGKGKTTFRNENMNYPEKINGRNTCNWKHDRMESCDGSIMHLIDGSRGDSSHTCTEECKVHPDVNHIGSCDHLLPCSNTFPIGKINSSVSGDSRNLLTRASQRDYCNTCTDPVITKCSSKRPQTVKENSLKEKLLEARLEGQNARIRALKGPVGGL